MQALPIKTQRESNPATRALEMLSRERGLPSLRTKSTVSAADHGKQRDNRRKKCSYDLSSMFHAACSTEADSFDFPSIDWVSDEEEDGCSFEFLQDDAFLPLQRNPSLPEEAGPTKHHSLTVSKRRKSLHGHKERHNATRSLVRSRAIATDLASLSTGHFALTTTQRTLQKQSTPSTTTKADDFFANLLEQLHDDFERPRTRYSITSSSPMIERSRSWSWED